MDFDRSFSRDLSGRFLSALGAFLEDNVAVNN